MNKRSVIGIIICAVIYLALYPMASACGLIHPMCYAYIGTILPLFFAFVYFYVAANMRCFGAALILNGFVLILGLIAGEGNIPFAVLMIAFAGIAELIRALLKYDTLKGVRWSFIPFAFSFYSYTIHWWTDTAESLSEAVEEMPAGYADKMKPVIDNIPGLVIAILLVIPVAILGIRLAEKIMKKTASKLR